MHSHLSPTLDPASNRAHGNAPRRTRPKAARLGLGSVLAAFALAASTVVAPVAPAAAIPSDSIDGQLRIGGLLPQTGNLSFLEPQTDAAARLAVRRINNAGGVLGKTVRWIPGDSGDFGDGQIEETVNRHIGAKVDAVVGPLSNGQTFDVIDTLTEEGRIIVSPSNTAIGLANYPDDGLYFRTSPNDNLEAKGVIDNLRGADTDRAMILARNDAYGTELSNAIASQGRRGGLEIRHLRYGDNVDTDVLARLTANKNPDAVVIVGFEETADIIRSLNSASVTGTNTLIHLVDGNTGNYVSDPLPAAERRIFNGVRGIVPGAQASATLSAALLRVDPELTSGSYAAETYDAVVLLALAAEQAGTDDPAKIAAEIPKVTRSGVACSNFIRCRALIRRNVNIDYQGESGPLTMSPKGELVSGPFTQFYWGADGNIDTDRTRTLFSRFNIR